MDGSRERSFWDPETWFSVLSKLSPVVMPMPNRSREAKIFPGLIPDPEQHSSLPRFPTERASEREERLLRGVY